LEPRAKRSKPVQLAMQFERKAYWPKSRAEVAEIRARVLRQLNPATAAHEIAFGIASGAAVITSCRGCQATDDAVGERIREVLHGR
jgi:hypothetical protein